jgi:hypothetical protein
MDVPTAWGICPSPETSRRRLLKTQLGNNIPRDKMKVLDNLDPALHLPPLQELSHSATLAHVSTNLAIHSFNLVV